MFFHRMLLYKYSIATFPPNSLNKLLVSLFLYTKQQGFYRQQSCKKYESKILVDTSEDALVIKLFLFQYQHYM